jgi:hypothetical protein
MQESAPNASPGTTATCSRVGPPTTPLFVSSRMLKSQLEEDLSHAACNDQHPRYLECLEATIWLAVLEGLSVEQASSEADSP